MTAVVIAEIAFAAFVSCVFIVLYAWHSNWRSSPMGRHMMAFNAVIAVELGSLLALAVWQVPPWVYAVVFGALDLVVLQRLLLLWRAQRNTSRED